MSAMVQQIVYTEQPERWHALAQALGFTPPYPPTREWAEFDGGGSLAVHHALPEHPAGTVDLHLLVDDLAAAASSLAPFGATSEEMEGVGPLLRVTSPEGVALTVSAGARATQADVVVQPIWFADDLAAPRRILESLGFTAGVVGDAGGWVELEASGGGMVALHALATADTADAPGHGLSFLARGDLDALADSVRRAGFDADVIDEAYGRTVRVADPDGGPAVWINGEQDDLYGYHREG